MVAGDDSVELFWFLETCGVGSFRLGLQFCCLGGWWFCGLCFRIV